MREILFRGKRLGDGEWVDGSLFIDDKGEKHEILIGYVNYRVLWEVDPDTVGQHTGLTDKNGKRIFEDDIVCICYEDSNGVKYREIRKVFYDSEDCRWYPLSWEEHCDFCDNWTEIQSLEVIGNIHDNPELIGERKDK